MILLLAAASGCGEGGEESVIRGKFDKGVQKFQLKQYRKASSHFKNFLRYYPDNILSKEAEYYLTRIKEVKTEEELQRIKHIYTFKEDRVFIQSLAFSSRGDLLVLATDEKEFRFYQTQLSQKTYDFFIDREDENEKKYAPKKTTLGPGFRFSVPFDEGDVTALSFSRDGSSLVAGFGDGRIRIWKAPDYKKTTIHKAHSEPVSDIGFSPDDRWMVSSSADGVLNIWDMQDLSQVFLQKKFGNRLDAIAFCGPDSSGINYLAVATENYIIIGSLQIHEDDFSFSIHLVLPKEREKVKHLSFSRGGKQLASQHGSGLVRIWNLDRQKIKSTLIEDNLLQKPLTWPVHESNKNTWALYEKTGWKLLTHQIRYMKSNISSMVLGYFGNLLITTHEDKTVIFWDVKKEKKLKIIRRPGIPTINYLLISPDQRTLILASIYKEIFLWDINIDWSTVL